MSQSEMNEDRWRAVFFFFRGCLCSSQANSTIQWARCLRVLSSLIWVTTVNWSCLFILLKKHIKASLLYFLVVSVCFLLCHISSHCAVAREWLFLMVIMELLSQKCEIDLFSKSQSHMSQVNWILSDAIAFNIQIYTQFYFWNTSFCLYLHSIFEIFRKV